MDKELLESLLRKKPENKFSTEQLLTDYYIGKGNNIFKASELAQNNITQLLRFVNTNLSEAKELNIQPVFSKAGMNVLELNPHYFPVKRIYEHLPNMSWQEFEDFSAMIIQEMFNAVDVRITQRIKDDGVDFTCKMPINSKYRLGTYTYIEVYGQSKRYSHKVGRIEIDKFTAYANRQKRHNTFPPQMFCIMTTSDFNSDAKSEISANSFWSINGLQIADLIYAYLNTVANSENLFRQYGFVE